MKTSKMKIRLTIVNMSLCLIQNVNKFHMFSMFQHTYVERSAVLFLYLMSDCYFLKYVILKHILVFLKKQIFLGNNFLMMEMSRNIC